MMRKRFIGSWFFFSTLVFLLALYLLVVLPPFSSLHAFIRQDSSVEIVDNAGVRLYVSPLEEGMRRQYRHLEDIPIDLRRIFVRTEDSRFFLHSGVDPVALGRSAVTFLRSGKASSGASTITMQLARIVLNFEGDRSAGPLIRKVEEMIAAVRIEARLSKNQILELWLNHIPFGYQTEGLAAAARRFFDGDLPSLTTAQVLALSLIPRNPSAYNPIDHPERVTKEVLRLAGRLGILVDQAAAAKDIALAQWGSWPDEAPHFSRMVKKAAEKEGIPSPIVTTLSREVQQAAEQLLRVYLQEYAGSRISNGAVLAIENQPGNIIAYVGSQGFYAQEGGQIDGVQVKNQPGSTIKPFLYACAFENGFSPNDIIADIPTDYGSTEVYVPRNFDRRYHGPVRLRTALASSLNVPATSVLEKLGVEAFLSFLVDFEFNFARESADASFERGLGIALGNAPVSLYELVRGFSVFQRAGVYADLNWTTLSGNQEHDRRRVISQSVAWMICDILSDPAERVVGFGMNDPFAGYPRAAVKTGTSSRNEHIWAIASSAEYTVGVWLGNFSGKTVIGRTGSSVPAGIALELLETLGRLSPQSMGAGITAGPGDTPAVMQIGRAHV